MGGCCCGFVTSGSILTFSPSKFSKEKGDSKGKSQGCTQMSLYSNRITYDGCPCFQFCCLCACYRGVIAFSKMHALEVNDDYIEIIMDDGSKITFGPMNREEANIIKNTVSENTSFLP